MRSVSVVILFLLLVGVCMREETVIAGNTPETKLQFTTSIIQERSCSSTILSLDLRFTFKNIGNEPVILDKQSFVTRTLVSSSLQAAAAKRYEATTRSDVFADTFPGSPQDISAFAVIGPGETYDLHTEQTRVSFLVREGMQDSTDYLRSGTYFLQVEIATWSYLADAKQFRERWKSTGLLWSEGLISQPMSFVVERNRTISKCR
jgi:hypothetical protein